MTGSTESYNHYLDNISKINDKVKNIKIKGPIKSSKFFLPVNLDLKTVCFRGEIISPKTRQKTKDSLTQD